VLNNSGTEDDAGDIFQETLVILYRKRKEGTLQISTSFRNYLIGTAKMLWLKELRRRRRSPVISAEVTDEESLAENMAVEAEEKSRYRLSENYARKRKFICKEKLIEMIKSDPAFDDD